MILIFLFLLATPSCSWAEAVFEDDFNNTDNINLTNTTAAVNTSESNITLPTISIPNAIAMNKYGDGYAVVTKTGIQMYEYDDATVTLKQNNVFSVPFVTDAIGVAIRQDNANIWVIRTDGIQYCKFNGAAMADDPALKASGIGQVLSVDAWENSDKAITLLNEGGKAQLKIYNADSGSLVTQLTQNTNIPDPIGVSIVKGTADLRVSTKDSIYYLSYDDATGQYVEDLTKKITGYAGIVSLSTDETSHTVTSNNNAQYVVDNDAGGGSSIDAYSIGSVTGAFAISLKPGSYDQALVNSAGEVQYWRYDDAQGKMVRDNSMEITGLQLAGGYLSPKEYWSKIFTTTYDCDEIKLTITEDVPANTSITYWVSSDSGTTFTSVTPNTWTPIPTGKNFVVKAVLSTTNNGITPKHLYVKLEATALLVRDLTITAIAKNDLSQVLPTTSFPVNVRAGADFVFEVTTEGYAQNVWADFTTGASVVLINKHPLTNDINVWWGTYTVPIDAVDPSTIGVTLTASNGTKQKHLTVNPLVNVRGKVSEVVDLQIIQ